MAQPLPPNWRKDYLPPELHELRRHLEQIPSPWRAKLLPLCEQVCHLSRMQGKLVTIAQETIDQLQLDMKYLMFDVEATRRERDEFRQQLEELQE